MSLYGLGVNALHILLVAPLLVYLGWQQGRVPQAALHLTLALGVLVLLYHLYQLWGRRNALGSYMAMINMFHVLVVAPVLIYIGSGIGAVPSQLWSVLLVVAPVIFLYHGWRAWGRLQG